MDIVLGIVAILLGLGVCFAGYRLFLFMLPIWGFVAGFWLGSAAITGLFGEGFLVSVTGWVVGIAVGLVAAVLSYFYWYISVAILGASVGASVATGLLHAVGVNVGFVLFLVGLVGAVLFAAAVFVLDLPKVFVIAYTAIAGAVVAVAGALLVLNQIEPGQLADGAAVAAVRFGWLWTIAWIVLAILGLGAQMQSTAEFEADLRRRIEPSAAAA